MIKKAPVVFFGTALAILMIFIIGMPWFSHVKAGGCSGEPTAGNTNSKAMHYTPGTAASPHIINLYVGTAGFSSAEQQEIATAVQSWFQSGTLSDNHIVINTVTTDPGVGAANSIRIVNDPTGAPDSVGYTTPVATDSNGAITGGSTISINKGFTFAGASSATQLAYDPSLSSAASFFTGLIAHEIGHALGLADSGELPCHATSTSVMGPGCGTNNQGDGSSPADPTSISPTNCDKATVAQNIADPSVNGNNTNSSTGADPVAGDPGSGTGSGTGTSGGGGGGWYCVTWTDWDQETQTLTSYDECYSY